MKDNKKPIRSKYLRKKEKKKGRKRHRKTKKIENKKKIKEQQRQLTLEKPIEEEPTLIETALNNHLSTHQIDGDGSDYKSFLENKKKIVLDLINKQKKPIKMRLILECKFYKKKW